MSFLTNAQNTSIQKATFNAVVQGNVTQLSIPRWKQKGFEMLQHHFARGAFHDSLERSDPPRCHRLTRRAILEKIMNWISDPDNLKLFLWIFGPTGGGKTAIAQTIAEMCAEDGNLAASFFFSCTVAGRKDFNQLVPTLAYQLALYIPEIREDVNLAIERDPAVFYRALATQIQNLILQPLNAAAKDPLKMETIEKRRHVVVLDGLDQCGDERSQREVLEVLSANVKMLAIPILFLITSRPEPQIRVAFSKPELDSQTLAIALDETWNPDNDIQVFLEAKFGELKMNYNPRYQLPDQWPGEDNISHIVQKSSGQFFYAATVMKIMDSHRHSPIKLLKIILGTAVPRNNDSPFAEPNALYPQLLLAIDEDDSDDSTHEIEVETRCRELERIEADTKTQEQALGLKRLENEGRRMEEVKCKEEIRRKEEEAEQLVKTRQLAEEARRKEAVRLADEARKKEEETKKREEEVKRREDHARKKEEKLRENEARLEEETRKKALQIQEREAALLLREEELKRREAEVRKEDYSKPEAEHLREESQWKEEKTGEATKGREDEASTSREEREEEKGENLREQSARQSIPTRQPSYGRREGERRGSTVDGGPPELDVYPASRSYVHGAAPAGSIPIPQSNGGIDDAPAWQKWCTPASRSYVHGAAPAGSIPIPQSNGGIDDAPAWQKWGSRHRHPPSNNASDAWTAQRPLANPSSSFSGSGGVLPPLQPPPAHSVHPNSGAPIAEDHQRRASLKAYQVQGRMNNVNRHSRDVEYGEDRHGFTTPAATAPPHPPPGSTGPRDRVLLNENQDDEEFSAESGRSNSNSEEESEGDGQYDEEEAEEEEEEEIDNDHKARELEVETLRLELERREADAKIREQALELKLLRDEERRMEEEAREEEEEEEEIDNDHKARELEVETLRLELERREADAKIREQALELKLLRDEERRMEEEARKELERREADAKIREQALELKLLWDEERRMEEEARKMDKEVKQKEEEMRRKEEEAERMAESRRLADEARRKEEEAVRLADEARKKEEETKRKEKEVKRREDDARKKAEDVRKLRLKLRLEEETRKEFQIREGEAVLLLREEELRRREAEAKQKEESRRKEAEQLLEESRRRAEETGDATKRKEDEVCAARAEKEKEKNRREQEAQRQQQQQESEWQLQDEAFIASLGPKVIKEQARLLQQAHFKKRAEEIKRTRAEERKRQDSIGAESAWTPPFSTASPGPYASASNVNHTNAYPTASSNTFASASPGTSPSMPRSPPYNHPSNSDRNASNWNTSNSTWSTTTKATTTTSQSTARPNPTITKLSLGPPVQVPTPLSPSPSVPPASLRAIGRVDKRNSTTTSKKNFAASKKRERLSGLLEPLSREEMGRLFEYHEKLWNRIAVPGAEQFTWSDIPWPMAKMPNSPEEISQPLIGAYVQSPAWPDKDGAKTTKDRIKDSLKRWHPDRFDNRCLVRVIDSDKERVGLASRNVVRYLNELLRKEYDMSNGLFGAD